MTSSNAFRRAVNSTRRHRPHIEALEDRLVLTTLWDQSSFVTGLGDGFGKADTSAIEAPSTLFGFNVRDDIFHAADDFTVPEESPGWAVSSITLYSYQTGSSTSSPYTDVYLRLWSGVPGEEGKVIAERSGNLLAATDFSNVYRVTETTLMNRDRPIMFITADVTAWQEFQDLGGVLAPGTYWLEWSFRTTGGTNVGVWGNPTVPAAKGDNARQLTVASGAWTAVADPAFPGHDFVFQVEGEEVQSAPGAGAGLGDFAYGLLAGTAQDAQPAANLATLAAPAAPLAQAAIEQLFAGPVAPVAETAATPSTPADGFAADRFQLDLGTL